jgi:hypothetical protein
MVPPFVSESGAPDFLQFQSKTEKTDWAARQTEADFRSVASASVRSRTDGTHSYVSSRFRKTSVLSPSSLHLSTLNHGECGTPQLDNQS